MPSQQFSTKDRILGAAEELFAQFGFAGTSLRQVTGRADVNIAAVNYHFGSKENLVNEVFRRRMDVMSAQRLAQLKQAQGAAPGQLEPILAAFGLIKRPSGVSEAAHRQRAAQELIRFAAAGIKS